MIYWGIEFNGERKSEVVFDTERRPGLPLPQDNYSLLLGELVEARLDKRQDVKQGGLLCCQVRRRFSVCGIQLPWSRTVNDKNHYFQIETISRSDQTVRLRIVN